MLRINDIIFRTLWRSSFKSVLVKSFLIAVFVPLVILPTMIVLSLVILMKIIFARLLILKPTRTGYRLWFGTVKVQMRLDKILLPSNLYKYSEYSYYSVDLVNMLEKNPHISAFALSNNTTHYGKIYSLSAITQVYDGLRNDKIDNFALLRAVTTNRDSIAESISVLEEDLTNNVISLEDAKNVHSPYSLALSSLPKLVRGGHELLEIYNALYRPTFHLSVAMQKPIEYYPRYDNIEGYIYEIHLLREPKISSYPFFNQSVVTELISKYLPEGEGLPYEWQIELLETAVESIAEAYLQDKEWRTHSQRETTANFGSDRVMHSWII